HRAAGSELQGSQAGGDGVCAQDRGGEPRGSAGVDLGAAGGDCLPPGRRPSGKVGTAGQKAPAEAGGLPARTASRDQKSEGSFKMVLKLAAFVDPTEARFATLRGVVCVRPPDGRRGPKQRPAKPAQSSGRGLHPRLVCPTSVCSTFVAPPARRGYDNCARRARLITYGKVSEFSRPRAKGLFLCFAPTLSPRRGFEHDTHQSELSGLCLAFELGVGGVLDRPALQEFR